MRKIIMSYFVFFIFLTIIYQFMGLAYLDNNSYFFVDKNFYISFLASSYEDIIFFSIVGLALFTYSKYNPKDDVLDNRINNLFTNTNVDTKVLNHSRKVAKNLAIYSPLTDVEITITEWNEELNAFKLNVNWKVELSSLIHDLDYIEKRPITIITDDTLDLEDGLYGRLTSVTNYADTIETVLSNEKLKKGYNRYELKEIIKPTKPPPS